jgi:hypothetical protein
VVKRVEGAGNAVVRTSKEKKAQTSPTSSKPTTQDLHKKASQQSLNKKPSGESLGGGSDDANGKKEKKLKVKTNH